MPVVWVPQGGPPRILVLVPLSLEEGLTFGIPKGWLGASLSPAAALRLSIPCWLEASADVAGPPLESLRPVHDVDVALGGASSLGGEMLPRLLAPSSCLGPVARAALLRHHYV